MLKRRTIQEAPELVVDNDVEIMHANTPAPIRYGVVQERCVTGDAPHIQGDAPHIQGAPPKQRTTYSLTSAPETPVLSTLEKRKVILVSLIFIAAIPVSGLSVVTPGSLAQSVLVYATICGAGLAALFALDWLNPQWYKDIPAANMKASHASVIKNAAMLACFCLSSFVGLLWFVHNSYHLAPYHLMAPVLGVVAEFDLDKALYQATEQYNYAVRENDMVEFRQHRENLLSLADKLPDPHANGYKWDGLPPSILSLTLAPSKTITESRLKKLLSWEINRQRYPGHRVTPMWSELATELTHQGRSREAESIFYATFAQNHGAYFATIPQAALERSLSLLNTEDSRRLRDRLRPLHRDQDVVIDMVPNYYRTSDGSKYRESTLVSFRELMEVLVANPNRAAHLPWTAKFLKDQKHQDEWQHIERVRQAFGGVNNLSGYDPNGIYSPILKGAIYAENSKNGYDVINPYAFFAKDVVQIKKSDWRDLKAGSGVSEPRLQGGD